MDKNIAEVSTAGFETDVQYQHTFSNTNSIWASVGAVRTNSKSSDTIPSFYISSHARFLTNYTIQYITPRFRISTTGIYKRRDPQQGPAFLTPISSDYFVMNVKFEVLVLKQRAGLFTQADNIFDKRYSDLLGAQMPGRWILFGAKFSF